jgi:DNA-directed RNA polymerase subunit M/transcription elongation factor TFIIS
LKIRKRICSECGAAMQRASKEGAVFYACSCGKGEDVAAKETRKGVVTYVQDLGTKTLTVVNQTIKF